MNECMYEHVYSMYEHIIHIMYIGMYVCKNICMNSYIHLNMCVYIYV